MAGPARLSARARRWLMRELAYLVTVNPAAARTFSAHMKDARPRLADFPDSGTTGRLAGTRRLVVGLYILVYRKLGDQIEITSIRHGRQHDPDDRLPDTDKEED